MWNNQRTHFYNPKYKQLEKDLSHFYPDTMRPPEELAVECLTRPENHRYQYLLSNGQADDVISVLGFHIDGPAASARISENGLCVTNNLGTCVGIAFIATHQPDDGVVFHFGPTNTGVKNDIDKYVQGYDQSIILRAAILKGPAASESSTMYPEPEVAPNNLRDYVSQTLGIQVEFEETCGWRGSDTFLGIGSRNGHADFVRKLAVVSHVRSQDHQSSSSRRTDGGRS